MSERQGNVAVSWTANRRRYARGLREFPIFRTIRRRLRWWLAAGAAVFALGALGGSPPLRVIGIYILLGGPLFYVVLRLAHLRNTIEGTLCWTFTDESVSIEGFKTTVVPISEIDRWYIAGDHLILGVRRHTGGRSSRFLDGAGAPLEAFSGDQLARAKAILTAHVGPES